MNRTHWLAAAFVLATSTLVLAESATTADQQWQQQMTQMQQLHQQWLQSKTPEQRQKLMEEHRQAMAGGMPMLGGCPGMPAGGMMGGMGKPMMGDAMGHGQGMWLDSVEQVDLHIKHLEQMLEQLHARRDMLAKP